MYITSKSISNKFPCLYDWTIRYWFQERLKMIVVALMLEFRCSQKYGLRGVAQLTVHNNNLQHEQNASNV